MKLFSLLLSSLFCSTLLVRPNLSPNTKENFTPNLVLDSICSSVVISSDNNNINITGVNTAPMVGVQVFNSSWASVFNQTYSGPQQNIIISTLPAGQYVVNVKLYTTGWATICEKAANVTLSSNPPPPPTVDTCGPTFQKSFGSVGGNEMALDIDKTSDGGYIIGGLAAATGTTNNDGLLMKFNSSGNLIWSKTYGGSQDDYFTGVISTTDGGYLATGVMNSTGYLTYSGDAWMVKCDAAGNIQWQKKYAISGGPGLIWGVTQTSDGGYAFSGIIPNTPGAADVGVVKTDATGNISWQKKIGTTNSDDGIGIVEDNHGGSGLVVTGYNYSNSNYDADIIKLDLATGNLLWSKTYDFDNRANRLNRIRKVSDGFVIDAANHDGFENANAVPMVLKTDFNGNVIFVKEYKANPAIGDGHMLQLADGSYIIEETELAQDANTDVHLMKTDATGNILWTKRYSRPDLQSINDIILDGNYVVGAGLTKNGSYNDVLLVKSDLSGKMGSCASVDESGTSRSPVVNSLSSPFTVNASLSLIPTNTTASAITNNPTSTVLCIDSCPPPPPSLTISSATVNESAGNAVLQVCLSAASTQQVTVQYATSNGTATAGSDYTASNGTAAIPAGQTCTTITIPILNDAVSESTENFTVTLSNPVNATIGTGTATATINDDDQSQYDCSAVTFVPGNQSITISGLTAPIAAIQIFNSSWATVFNQAYTNSPGTVNVSLAPGTYLAKVTFYTNGWVYICDKSQNVTIVNQCPAGTICAFNTCPSQTVNLNNFYSIPNLPAGTAVSWHTATPATDANKMTDAQAQSVSTAGTYYAAINISGANCYSQTIPVNVTITPCNSAGNMADLQAKIAIEMPSEKIMVYPNPFTHSVRITIQSEMNESAVLVLTDLMGQQLRTKPVQLARGSNQFSLEGLDHFPSGSYLLKVTSSSGTQTFKLLRQQ